MVYDFVRGGTTYFNLAGYDVTSTSDGINILSGAWTPSTRRLSFGDSVNIQATTHPNVSGLGITGVGDTFGEEHGDAVGTKEGSTLTWVDSSVTPPTTAIWTCSQSVGYLVHNYSFKISCEEQLRSLQNNQH